MLVLTGCGGPDLGKQNFDRSTVSVEPAQGRGKVPAGSVESDLVSADTLRGVDPCGVLADGALDALGEPGDVSAQGWSECMVDVTDPADDEVEVRLELGASVGASPVEPSGQLAGLPLTVNERESGGCDVTVMTSEESGLGITVGVDSEDGQVCGAGKVVLDEVLEQLHRGPATLPDEAGSVLRLDPCTVLDSADVSDVLDKDVTGEPIDLHGCVRQTEDPSVSVSFRESYDPAKSDHGDTVDLGSGVEGYSDQTSDDLDVCDVDWAHRDIDDRSVELVTLTYRDYSGDPKSDKPCDKAESVAKSVVSALPDAS